MKKKPDAAKPTHKHQPTPSQGQWRDSSAVLAPHGLIPGRPGQEVNSGGDSIFPPLRPDPPRAVDRKVKP